MVFSTARRRNGYAGLHDLASQTRVVRAIDSTARDPLPLPESRLAVSADAQYVGPYALVDGPVAPGAVGVFLAYDNVLRRSVWIRSQPIGTPPVSPARRDVARSTRLRWLNGKRTAEECWDAYEAPEGRAFVAGAPHRPRWSAVRFWLLDLVRELEATVADDRHDVRLDVEHVWLTRDGRAVLLDFRCPALPAGASTSIEPSEHAWTARGKQVFLRQFALAALRGEDAEREDWTSAMALVGQLPLHAHAFLTQLERGQFPSLKAIAAALTELLGKRAVLTRARRSAHVALCAALPACFLAAGIVSGVARGGMTVGGITAPLMGSLILLTTVALWSAALFRGGFMLQAFGIAVVTAAVNEASRQRAFMRAIAAWSPCLLLLVATLSGWPWIAAGAVALIVGGTALAVMTPVRGPQDRILGTWLIPR